MVIPGAGDAHPKSLEAPWRCWLHSPLFIAEVSPVWLNLFFGGPHFLLESSTNQNSSWLTHLFHVSQAFNCLIGRSPMCAASKPPCFTICLVIPPRLTCFPTFWRGKRSYFHSSLSFYHCSAMFKKNSWINHHFCRVNGKSMLFHNFWIFNPNVPPISMVKSSFSTNFDGEFCQDLRHPNIVETLGFENASHLAL